MSVIYEPKGRALEYSPLALNLYTGCVYACKYCYVPHIPSPFYNTRAEFHSNVEPRKDILELLLADCKTMKGDPRDVLLCFTSDPYQPKNIVTREALLILEKYEMRVSILTKGGMNASRDFDILARNEWKFGTTLLFWHDGSMVRQWEPGAASPSNRYHAILNANAAKIYTWVSIEPVIDPIAALTVILELRDIVDHFKIGKINYHKYIEKRIDWKRFRRDAEALLEGKNYYLKKDLLEITEKEFPREL